MHKLNVIDRFNENISEKKKIAEKAAKIIKKGDFIYLDAGTTIFYVIEKLKDLDVTVVTNGLMHLEELMKYKIKTVVLGGEIKGQTGAIVGVEAINFISKYRFDKCFLGTNGISLDTGFTTPEVNEAYLKKKAIELSEESFVLADKRKFNRVSNINFSSFKECKIITSKEAIKENNRYKKYFY